MKKALKVNDKKINVYYFVDGEKIYGLPSGLTGNISSELYGNISGLTGNISGLYGNISSDLYGNISGLTGNISGLYGNISSDLYGNIDDCELTQEDRDKGVNITDLVEHG